MTQYRFIGIDMALANMGLASARYEGQMLKVESVHLISTESTAGKDVRKSSSHLARARILREGLTLFCGGADLAFAEVPSGSQSAQASHALGVAVGVLAGCPIPLIEVTPMEVKRLFTSSKRSVPKAEIIEWAMNQWPDAGWLMIKRKGRMEPTKANEHLADACATLAAGLRTEQFAQLTRLTALGANNAAASTHHHGSSSGRQRVLLV